ncbi:hypothetical protein EDF58_1082 [Novosphingobium sp. PhB57]|jgi:hypothetical protein|uniref:hypothetical protein n=1 Tax=Novosphingobium sp. PhB57 TaxID=2485107 RepID=UPI0010534B07|nr:hypothetical protein [Novosphingobium sp. PhB57]TCU54571.1 hypothetical protein EDF58_1082 [Novosphingobium sp. PhB57]
MTHPMLLFSLSSNGDQWYLARGNGTDKTTVVHEANRSSGGAISKISIEDFLRANPQAPERQDFVSLVADLLGNELDDSKARAEVLLIQLRDATEEDAANALLGAKVQLPLTTPYEALEFYNCMVDVVTGQRAIDVKEDAHRIRPGFGSTHV